MEIVNRKIARVKVVNVKLKSGIRLVGNIKEPSRGKILRTINECLDGFDEEPIDSFVFYCVTRSGWWNTRYQSGNLLTMQLPDLVKNSLIHDITNAKK